MNSTPVARMSWRVDLAELVGRDLADEAGAAAERGDAGRGVRRPSRR